MFCWPLMPPASVAAPQPKLLKASVVPMLLPAVPAVLAVTFTWPLDGELPTAVTPVEPLALMVVARLVASVATRAEIAKWVLSWVAVVPPLRALLNPVIPVKPLESVKAFCAVPGSSAMTVTVLARAVAVRGKVALPVRALPAAWSVDAVDLEYTRPDQN